MASEQTNSKFPAKIYDEALDEVIKQHFGSSYKDCTIKITAGSSVGDNYGGDVFRVTVRHTTKETLSVIVKTPPENAVRRQEFISHEIFSREAMFYNEVIGMFNNFQKEKGINIEKEGFHEVAKCFKTIMDEPHEGVFLEDIKVRGFDMHDRFTNLTADHVLRVMETLGKFHAMSLALKDQRPDLMAPHRDLVDILFMRDKNSMKTIADWFESLKQQGLEVLRTFDNQDLVQRIENFLEKDMLSILESLVNGKSAEPHAVLCHGDCWNNNMMFREENGVPVECCLLDWQILRYASPICDVTNYIFGGTTKELRDNHYKEFLDAYYKSLTELLERLGSDPSKVFPRSAFDDQLKNFGKFGLAMAMMSLPVITNREAVDMDEMAERSLRYDEEAEENMESLKSPPNEVYVSRMKGVFQDMYDLGYV